MSTLVRQEAFAQSYSPTIVDRFGVWLSARQLRRWVPDFSGKAVGDFGCGYHAAFSRTIVGEARSITLVDVALSPELERLNGVTAIRGQLPSALEGIASESLDVVMCVSVLEHLWEPLEALKHFRRLLRPGGVGLFNVPSWLGKTALEFSAFRLGLSPADEMDDHKNYYDVRDLWPLLIQAGFKPRNVRCFSHKFGLNTFAVCRTSES